MTRLFWADTETMSYVLTSSSPLIAKDSEALALVLSKAYHPARATLKGSQISKNRYGWLWEFMSEGAVDVWQPTDVFRQGTSRSKLFKKALEDTKDPEVVAYQDGTVDIGLMLQAFRVLWPARTHAAERFLDTEVTYEPRNQYDRQLRRRVTRRVAVVAAVNSNENKLLLARLINKD